MAKNANDAVQSGVVYGVVRVCGELYAARRTGHQQMPWESVVRVASDDEFANPQTVKIYSPSALGRVGEIVTCLARVGGKPRYVKESTDKDTGEVRPARWVSDNLLTWLPESSGAGLPPFVARLRGLPLAERRTRDGKAFRSDVKLPAPTQYDKPQTVSIYSSQTLSPMLASGGKTSVVDIYVQVGGYSRSIRGGIDGRTGESYAGRASADVTFSVITAEQVKEFAAALLASA